MRVDHLEMPLGRAAIDRQGLRRREDGLLARLQAQPGTRAIVVAGGKIAALCTSRLAFFAPPDLAGHLGHWAYLGTGDDGVSYLSLVLPHAAPGLSAVPLQAADSGGKVTWLDVRDIGAALPDAETGLAVCALSLGRWQLSQQFCPACGAPTDLTEAGWAARCQADGSLHYPRTDPAVIMAILDQDDRILLGRGRAWSSTKRYSILAGYVEAGEPLEAAVRREVDEEAGIAVGTVRYLGNQPWPPSGSLMVAFAGAALGTTLTIDHEELDDARWYSRDDLERDVAAATLELPPPAAIACTVIGAWRSGELTVADLA